MSYKYIKLMAGELEAGWKTKREDLHDDDSLQSSQFHKSAARGELISKPYPTKEEYKDWVAKAYDDIAETPLCAAYHIHTSFRNINYYAKCMEEEFFDAFFTYIEQWAKDYPIRNPVFWDRLRGKNKYCVREFRADAQAKCRTKDEARKGDLRRTALNYSYGLHKTLENRLFPTFVTFDAAWSATESYFNFIEDYLDKHPVSTEDIVMDIVDEQELFTDASKQRAEENIIKLKPFNLYSRKGVKTLKPYKTKDNIIANPCNGMSGGKTKGGILDKLQAGLKSDETFYPSDSVIAYKAKSAVEQLTRKPTAKITVSTLDTFATEGD